MFVFPITQNSFYPKKSVSFSMALLLLVALFMVVHFSSGLSATLFYKIYQFTILSHSINASFGYSKNYLTDITICKFYFNIHVGNEMNKVNLEIYEIESLFYTTSYRFIFICFFGFYRLYNRNTLDLFLMNWVSLLA